MLELNITNENKFNINYYLHTFFLDPVKSTPYILT